MPHLDWNDIRVFLAVAEAQRIGSAAVGLRLDPTTLSRRLRRLEETLEATLFERTREGLSLTEAGEALLAKAEDMAAAAGKIGESGGKIGTGSGLAGNLRISVSEGFGSQFLTRFIPDFTDAHPNLTVELIANSGFLSPSKREADIAVMLSRPKAGPILCQKLADYRLMLYASRIYLERSGMPRDIEELAEGHRLISYVPDLVYAPELNYLEDFRPGLRAQLRSSSINAQFQLVAEGAGIGVLPHFIASRSPELRQVCPDHSIERSFWVVTHKDTQQLARVRVGKSWLQKCVADGRATLLALNR